VTVHLDPDEAVVLFELLWRWCEAGVERAPDPACFESPAECAALIALKADLERQLAAPFRADYRAVLAAARGRLAPRWDRPTLGG
jgi:hypothetical protein